MMILLLQWYFVSDIVVFFFIITWPHIESLPYQPVLPTKMGIRFNHNRLTSSLGHHVMPQLFIIFHTLIFTSNLNVFQDRAQAQTFCSKLSWCHLPFFAVITWQPIQACLNGSVCSGRASWSTMHPESSPCPFDSTKGFELWSCETMNMTMNICDDFFCIFWNSYSKDASNSHKLSRRGIPLANGDAFFPNPPPWAYPLWTGQDMYRTVYDRMSRSSSEAIDQAMAQFWEAKVKFVRVNFWLRSNWTMLLLNLGEMMLLPNSHVGRISPSIILRLRS